MSITKADPERQDEVEEEEQEDEAPESVTFETSRAVALEAFKAESARNKSKPSTKKDKKKNRKAAEGEKSRLDLLREQAEEVFDDQASEQSTSEPAEAASSHNNVTKFDDELEDDFEE